MSTQMHATTKYNVYTNKKQCRILKKNYLKYNMFMFRVNKYSN